MGFRILKVGPRNDLVQPRSSPINREAQLAREEYLVGRYRAPGDKVAAILDGMDRVTRTLLEIEMAEHRRAVWTVEHDPFGVM